MDLDVPLNGGTTLLHWLESGVTPSSSNGTLVTPSDPFKGAPYVSPAPPPGNAHRYVELLFEQPDNFEIPSDFQSINPPADVNARIGFNLQKFIDEAGLTELVAANFFRVQNGTSSASGTGAAGSGAATSTAASGASQTGLVVTSAASQSAAATGSSQAAASGTASASGSTPTGAGVAGLWGLFQRWHLSCRYSCG